MTNAKKRDRAGLKTYEGLVIKPLSLSVLEGYLAASIPVDHQDVTVDKWETLKSTDDKDYFDVTFE